MKRIKANTVNTYVENGITITVLKDYNRKSISYMTKHKGRTRTADEYSYMHRVSRK